MVGGVYPNAAVTLAFVRLIVPELLVILLPVLTKPNAEPVAAPYVVLVGTCHPPSPRKNLSLLTVLAAGTNPAVPEAAVVAPL